VLLLNSSERRVLGQGEVRLIGDPESFFAYFQLRGKLVIETNIIDQLQDGVLLLELEEDGAVVAAGRFDVRLR